MFQAEQIASSAYPVIAANWTPKKAFRSLVAAGPGSVDWLEGCSRLRAFGLVNSRHFDAELLNQDVSLRADGTRRLAQTLNRAFASRVNSCSLKTDLGDGPSGSF